MKQKKMEHQFSIVEMKDWILTIICDFDGELEMIGNKTYL